MSKKLPVLLFFVALFILFSNLALAQLSASDTVTINVTVEAVAEITVIPDFLEWAAFPGRANVTKFIDIINTGSLNVSQIYVYVDTLQDETQRPYGSTNATNYAAGGVIVLKNETYDKFFFAGRIEWNWTQSISNLQTGAVSSPVAWGFFKNTSFEYVWLVGNGTNGFCNNTVAQFAIEDDPDNGTVATRTPIATGIDMDGGDSNFGYFSINRASSPLYESCVAVSYDCSKIYIYKYDRRSGFATCANSRYVQEANLIPSDLHTLSLNVFIPLGIPAGNLNTATLTVYATA